MYPKFLENTCCYVSEVYYKSYHDLTGHGLHLHFVKCSSSSGSHQRLCFLGGIFEGSK